MLKLLLQMRELLLSTQNQVQAGPVLTTISHLWEQRISLPLDSVEAPGFYEPKNLQ